MSATWTMIAPAPRARPCLAAMMLALLAALPAAGKSSDRCEISIGSVDRIEPDDDYDPYQGSNLSYHRLEVDYEDGPACTVLISIDDGQNGTRVMENGQNQLVYDLYKDSGRSQRINDISGPQSGTLTATLSANDDKASFTFYSYIPPGQVVKNGTYTDRVTVNVYEVRNGVPVGPIDSRSAQVRAKVRQVVSARVTVNGVTRTLSGSSGVLNMGELSRSGGGSFELHVAGNSDYDLSLSSENAGRLVSANNPDGIGYSVSVGGRTSQLTRGSSFSLGGNGTYTVAVQVDDVSQAVAGTYSDNLILIISAR
jgi:spore coat protein U-like protein